MLTVGQLAQHLNTLDPTLPIGISDIDRHPGSQRATITLRVSRAFPIGKSKLEASFEAFNLFNKINYTSATPTFYTIAGSAAAPTLVYNAATFNTYTNANSGTFSPRPREIQLGVRYTF